MNTCPKCGAEYDSAQTFCTRDGEVLQDDYREMIGRVLDGQYQIEEFIGEGGMGRVYRAQHTLLGDKVAIKILPPEMRRNTSWLKRFQREGQAARRFHHPNSVMVHDLRTSSEGEIYLVMEYVEGVTLDEEVATRGGRLSLAEILKVVESVASVLDAAHEQGVVHRDLKPSNIMITNRGVVKLLDLGVAKVTDEETNVTQLTATGQILGTPYFMSPEQWGESPRDGGKEIDGRTDIYSLGVVTYQLTAGELPFKGTSIVALHRAHCHEAPRPLEEFDKEIPLAWSRAVLRAMSKDRNDRQATAGEFARELRAALGEVDMPEESALSAAQTVITERQSTSPVMHETPKNLHARTVNSYDKAHAVQSTTPPSYQSAPVQTLARKSSNSTLIIIAIVAFLILTVGGFAFWKWRSGIRAERRRAANAQSSQASDPEAATNETTTNTDSQTASNDNNVAAMGDAFMRYHLLLTKEILGEQVTTSGHDPIESG
ncbi:MAG TPA: serine/threonine-protein kinase, partial [Pyrinomonadaceae bacterium]|nr:serine/threonine-protein kinase [Pyrinomonadaceae bacterium]